MEDSKKKHCSVCHTKSGTFPLSGKELYTIYNYCYNCYPKSKKRTTCVGCKIPDKECISQCNNYVCYSCFPYDNSGPSDERTFSSDFNWHHSGSDKQRR